MRISVVSFLLVCAACSVAPPTAWGDDLTATLVAGRQEGRHVVVFFALAGREASDRMAARTLHDPAVLAALREGGYLSVRVDGFARQRLYQEWLGSGEGMGIAVQGPDGHLAAARPGPQDPPELAAFLRQATALRPAVASARAALTATAGPAQQFALGDLLLQLGCRREAEPLLLAAATGGSPAAPIRMALLHGQDGRLEQARQWLRHAGSGAEAMVVEGYVQFKERRHPEAVQTLEAALRQELPPLERQRARLFLGKALHEAGRSPEALALLQSLAAEATGSPFEGAALHTIAHIQDPSHGHDH